MLQLKNIVKEYLTGDTKVQALKGIDITFRDNEFVSILGPSGCGKTTMLNIIGGLDHYTSGDLIINGVSTKEYRNRDWDSYRNHSIGFVFQSYNLIPHQSVLANVELALTLSGVSRKERRERAIEALNKVGLGDQLHKRPNQMSGGQMQRVAIARALVNNPSILLADEPTGALDTQTSVQVMDILKEIAKDKLIIMVTHNPELANEYSTRIVKLLDGKIIDDSRPFNGEEENETAQVQAAQAQDAGEAVQAEAGEGATDTGKSKTTNANTAATEDSQTKTSAQAAVTAKKVKKQRPPKTSMSFLTALSLSLNNLMTKKGRTLLTAFAGSIGIIGIALILSVSNGIQEYIDDVQRDTLSSYPITIQKETMDVSVMVETMTGQNEEDDHSDEDAVYSNDVMVELMDTMTQEIKSNDLRSFKKYLDGNKDKFNKDIVSNIQYSYDIPIIVYKETKDKDIKVNPSTLFDTIGSATGMEDQFGSSSGYMQGANVWSEMLDNQKVLDEQYDVIAGRWPKEASEVVLLVDKNNQISDYALYSLGLKDPAELEKLLKSMVTGEKVDVDQVKYTFDELMDQSFKLILPTDYFKYNDETGLWEDKTEDEIYMASVVAKALDIKIAGIIRPSEDNKMTNTSGGILYTSALTQYVINGVNDAQIVKEQKENQDVDVFTGIPFDADNEDADISIESVMAFINAMPAEQKAQYEAAIQGKSEEEIIAMFEPLMTGEITMDFINQYMAMLPEEERAQYEQYMSEMSEEQIVAMFSKMMAQNTTSATYDGNLTKLGVCDLDSPSMINIYATSFEAKDKIADLITEYNEGVDEEQQIEYTDYVKLLMSSITTIINAISYVLIAFVAISLVVSSIMIGIITYISVLERTKEIGILRAIGASKKDVSRVFNAETTIVGFCAGFIGIVVTLLLLLPINAIILHLTDIKNLAKLPVAGGIILILISVVLTLIAGLAPSRVAAKKDPVEALRTE